MKELPEIGKSYPFFDDGKIKSSRLHKATITRIFKYRKIPDNITSTRLLDCGIYTLSDYIKNQQLNCDWLFAPNTDYVIEASIPEYDNDPIYFIRTNRGGWFSIEFTNCWQSGELDINWEAYNRLTEFYQEENMYDQIEELQKIMG